MDQAPESLNPKDTCFDHLIGLKYALAGDLESAEPLEILLNRWENIEWTDPAFIQFSEEMRAGLPNLTPEQAAALQPSLLEMVHSQNERLSHNAETMMGVLPALRKSNDDFQKVKAICEGLIGHFKIMTDLHLKMRKQLETLGADISPYELPEIPGLPETP